MNVLMVCRHFFKTSQAGDATQAKETVKELGLRGYAVDRLYVKYDPLQILDENDNVLSIHQINEHIDRADVIHLLPITKELCALGRQLHHKPTVGSSIFWAGLHRALIAYKNISPMRPGLGQARRELLNLIPFRNDWRGVDVFLPNTNAEGRRVMHCFRHNRSSIFFKVVNGFRKPSYDLESIPRPLDAPKGDYIVVPGTFAWRKNQLSLIKALKNTSYEVVFLGEAFMGQSYYEKCRSLASDRMHFLGYRPSDSEDYWSILRHARVACLASECETPGIALLEAAYAGARPVITKLGGTKEYYGTVAEYLDPCSLRSIRKAVERGWNRGRLSQDESSGFLEYNWARCAKDTIKAYEFAVSKYEK